MVQPMGLGALAENHSFSLAPYEEQNLNLGKFKETGDGWTIKVCDVSKGRGNHSSLASRVRLGS